MRFPKVNPKQNFPALEETILQYWQKEKIFEETVERESAKGEFVFYDGPPFATGLPHYGHILQGVIKDLMPRYKTMQGYKVPRRWGWDCHGLPVENLIEKELGLKNRQAIEDYGIGKFNEACRDSVLRYATEWKKTVRRMGRWIDMEHDYKTMDLDFMDSVWWVFHTLWQKGLIYEGLKPMHICPRCETPLSNFEVGLGYRETTDLTAIAKFELVDEPNTFLLAWTTTPWTLPGNVALAVGEAIEYVKLKLTPDLTRGLKTETDGLTIKQDSQGQEYETILKKIETKQNEIYILAKDLTEKVFTGQAIEILETFKGKNLIGKTYNPIFPYFADKDSHETIPGIYFITFNTENSLPIFKDPKLRQLCAEAFAEVAKENNYKIYELAILPDHIHLLLEIEEGGQSLPKTIQQLKWFSSWKLKSSPLIPQISGGLSKMIDKKNGKSYLKLWREGYDRKFIYSAEDFHRTSDYIHSNPVKAKLPSQDYHWLTTFDDVNQTVRFTKPQPLGFRIVAGSFVSTSEGTGIVHIAPAFGDDDYALSKVENLPVIQHVSMDGRFTAEVRDFAGMEVKPAKDPRETDEKIIKWLEEKEKLFTKGKVKHSYPFCWRCEAPLLNYATSSWFVSVEKIKKDLLKNNQKINWVPEHIQQGRFGKWLEGARDWAISRNRFWGCPLPIWRCQCGEIKCITSRSELEKLSQSKITDLHKQFVDDITLPCQKCRGKMHRIPEVLDCWFESGSMPYAQTASQDTTKLPAHFIAEAQDQTRGWFYTLHVLATALQNKPAFAHCICSGLVLAEDGQKMSKSKKNFPPPENIFQKYGADAMRLYLMSSPVVNAQELRFSERGVEETLRSVLLPLWNTYYFFTTYANADGWENNLLPTKPKNKLDRWILSELNLLIQEMSDKLEAYEIQAALKPLAAFLDGLTNWYIRRSRRRFWKSENDADKTEAYATLCHTLQTISKLLAPVCPFVAEEIYRGLSGEKSVHLTNWPTVDTQRIDKKLSQEIATTRKIISLGLAIRGREKIKVRLPLSQAVIALPGKMKLEIETIREELNVKQVEITENPDSIATIAVEVNARFAGKRLGGKVQEIIRLAKGGCFEMIKTGVKIGDEILTGEEVKIGYKGKAGQVVESDAGIVVSLDTQITPELELEGQARDLVRAIQDLRKQADYAVSDRIELQLENAEKILHTWRDYIAGETLAERITSEVTNAEATETLETIKIGIRRV